jgi:hypothetical protein
LRKLYKMFSLFKIILLLSAIGNTYSNPVKLKGGLIYKYEGMAQINQDYVTYKRTLDTTALLSVAQRLKDSTTLYKEYCSLISNYERKGKPMLEQETYDRATKLNISVSYLATPLKYPLKDTDSVCSRLKARRVEIKDIATYDAARTFANEHGIEQFEAGIKFNTQTNRFQFISNSAPAKLEKIFPHIVYGGYYTGKEHLANWEQDSYVKTEAHMYPLVYSKPAGNFVLRLADMNDRERLDYVMCEKDVVRPTHETSSKNMFMEIAVHSCKRDLMAVSTQTQYTLMEIEAITNLNYTLSEEPKWTQFFPQFEPLNNKELSETFWYNIVNQNIPKPQLGSREKREAIFRSTEPIKSPFVDDINEYNSFMSDNPNPKCYWTPTNMFSDDASNFFYFPYEEWEIYADVPRTLPDYVILLHTIWRIHVEKHYNTLSFAEWMAHQAQRIQLYTLLRKSSMIHRVERNLNMIYDETQHIFRMFLRSDRKWPRDFDLRIQRTLEHLQTEILDKLIEQQLVDLNITMPDLLLLNPNEIETFVNTHFRYNLTNPDSNIDEDSDSKLRRKRAIPILPMIAGISGFAVGSTTTLLIDSLRSDKSKKGIDENQITILRRLATDMKSIKIDQQQTAGVLNNVIDRLQLFEMQILGRFDGVTSITMAMDLKGLNQQLQTVAQMTLLKYNAAVMAAVDGRTSPYVLPQKELDGIVQKAQRNKQVTLSHDLNAIRTLVSIENNTIVFYLEVPIVDAKKEFNLYTVTPLPIFMNNGTYLPNLDSNHIAINNDGDKFTTLNELQLSACLDTPPRCESNTAITPIRNAISCVGTSYITDAQACPLYQTTSAPVPRFYFFDDVMVYSTPADTSIYIVCQPAPGQTSQRDQTISLRGYGLHQLAPACSLTLPDGTTHQTPTKTVNVTEVGSQLFREIFQQPQPDPEVVYIDRTPVFSNMPRAKITLESGEDIVDFTRRLTDGFHPATVTANTAQTVLIVIVIFAILALCYFCRHRFCCCKKKPRSPIAQVPDFEEDIPNRWFPESDEQEPDTISRIAARPDPPAPSRFSAFRAPLQTFYSSFPAWSKVPQPPQFMTSEQMQRHQQQHQEQQPLRQATVPSTPSSILRTQSLDYPSTSHAQPISQSQFDRMKEEQQRLMEQHSQNHGRRPEPHVSFHNDPTHPSAQISRHPS